MEAPTVFNNFRNQYIAVYIYNIITIVHGLNVGWISNAILKFQSVDSPLDHTLSAQEVSWIGGMSCIGAILGTFASGYQSYLMGCKHTLSFLAIPSIVAWLLIIITSTAPWVIASRFLTGWTGGGVFATAPLYVADISDSRIRGRLGSKAIVFRNCGILAVFILSSILEYRAVASVLIVIPIVFITAFTFMPNTPQHWVKVGNFEKANKSLRFYKNCKLDSEAESKAISKELDRLKVLSVERLADKKLRWSDICKPGSAKALVTGVVLSCLSQLSGAFLFTAYPGLIIPNMIDYMSWIIIVMGIAQLLGSLLTSHIADKLGRKKLLIISLSCAVVGQAVLAILSYIEEDGHDIKGYDPVSVICTVFVVFSGSVGVVPMATVCTLEILPRKIRTLGMALTTITLNLSAFALMKLFPVWIDPIKLYGCLCIIICGCVLGIIYIIFMMEETRGRDLDSIGKKRVESTG